MSRHLYDTQYVTQYIGLTTNCQENSSAAFTTIWKKKYISLKGGKIFFKSRKYFTIFKKQNKRLMSNHPFPSLYLLGNIHNISDKYIVMICHANFI